MLLSYLCKYAFELDYECNLASICNDRKKFVGVPMHPRCVRNYSLGLGKIRDMILKLQEKHIRKIFVSKRKPLLLMARHL